MCDVCAVNEVVVHRAAAKLAGRPWVESVNPLSLDGVFAMFRRVGDLVDALRVEQGARAEDEAGDADRDERDADREDATGAAHHIASRVESHLVCSTPGRTGTIMRAG